MSFTKVKNFASNLKKMIKNSNTAAATIRNSLSFILCFAYAVISVFWFKPIPSIGFIIALVTLALAFFILVKKIDNVLVKAGSFVIIIGAIVSSLMLLTGEGTGNLQGWEIIFADMVFMFAEITAIILYINGILK